jgi:hypothetical protein
VSRYALRVTRLVTRYAACLVTRYALRVTLRVSLRVTRYALRCVSRYALRCVSRYALRVTRSVTCLVTRYALRCVSRYALRVTRYVTCLVTRLVTLRASYAIRARASHVPVCLSARARVPRYAYVACVRVPERWLVTRYALRAHSHHKSPSGLEWWE